MSEWTVLRKVGCELRECPHPAPACRHGLCSDPLHESRAGPLVGVRGDIVNLRVTEQTSPVSPADHLFCVGPCLPFIWLCGCASENSPWIFLHTRFSSQCPRARKLHVLCWYFNVESEGSARQWDAIRHRVRSELLHQERQCSVQPSSAPESIPYVRLPWHSQHGGMVRLTIILYGLRRSDAGPIVQTGDWSGKVWRRIWDFEGRSLHRHQGSFNNAASCTDWCSLAVNPPPQQPQISHTILTQADWCAVRTLARWRAGSRPRCEYLGGGCARDLVRSGQHRSRRNAVSAAFSFGGTHLHPSLVSAPAKPVWEFPLQNRLALPERPEHTILQILEVVTNSRRRSSGRGSSGERLLGAAVPAGSNLRRPNGGMRSPHSILDSRLSRNNSRATSWIRCRETEQKLDSRRTVSPGCPLPNWPVWDIVLTERDKQLPAEPRRACAMALPR